MCKLLTVAEVSAAIGSTVDLAVPNADDNYGYCDYKERGDNKVKVYVTRSATGAAYWDTVKINKGEVVPGIGDEAYWSADSFLPGLYFKKGGVLAYISGATYPEDGILDLGRLLASRM